VDPEIVISSSTDGRLRWWNVVRGECLRVSDGHQGSVPSLRRSPDGRLVASCSEDGAIMLWDRQTGEHRATVRRDRPYERLNITGIRGLTTAQQATLRGLGALEHPAEPDSPPAR
jgi:WD40 repeat protein